MAGALDQIAAAIPFRALLLIGHQNARLEEQPVPAAHDDAIVEGPAQLQRRRRVPDRRQRRQIGPDRQDVLAGQFREIRVGEGRVIARTVRCDAVAQRAVEIVVAPAADAGIAVGGQIGRIDAAERRIDALAPGERFQPDRRCGSLRNRRPPSAPCRGRCPRPRARRDLRRPTNAAHKRTAGQNRPHGPMSSLHLLTCSGVIPRKQAKPAASRHFAPGRSGRHKPKRAGVIPGTKLRSFKARGSIAQICSASGGKSDIDWF